MKVSDRIAIVALIVSVVMSSSALVVSVWIYENPKPVSHTPNVYLPLFFMPRENISWTSPTYPELYNGKIPIQNYPGITSMTVFFFFTAPSPSFNQTVYARLCIDVQKLPCAPLYPVTTFVPGDTVSYSTSITISLSRVTSVVADEFLSCYRCNVILSDVAVNATLFYG